MKDYLISNEESTRINIIKFIAIVFVVYIHSYSIKMNFSNGTDLLELPRWLLLFENLISHTIASCGVPIFFLCSSILLFKKKREYIKTIKGKVKTLLFPYLIWNTLWIVVYILLQSVSFTSIYFSGNKTTILNSSFSEWLGLYGIGKNMVSPHNYPLWFMRDLMIVTLLFPIIRKIANRFPKQLLFCSIITLLLPVDFPLKTAIVWFCLGAVIVKMDMHITFFDHISMIKLSFVYVIGAIITLLTKNYTIDMIFIIFGIIYWVRVTKNIYESPKIRNIFLKISKWTFIIYVMHELTLSSLKKICFKLLPKTPLYFFMCYVLLPVFVIVGCCIFGYIFKRFFSKIYSFATGER